LVPDLWSKRVSREVFNKPSSFTHYGE
jgi:hypothetical protein